MTILSPPTQNQTQTTAPASGTGSRATRILGVATVAVSAVAALMGLVTSKPDVVQEDAVRLFYVHVPVVSLMYIPVALCTLASIMWLRKRTDGWDALAASSADIAALFVGLGLVTGAIWGRITWGTYWTWDARLTSTAMLFLLLLGYLALRRYPASAESRSRMSSIVGVLLVPNAIIVHFSVSWWRSLHQESTLKRLDPQIGGSQLSAYAVAQLAVALLLLWLMIHRFRVAWLERSAERHELDVALAERTADADTSAALATDGSVQ